VRLSSGEAGLDLSVAIPFLCGGFHFYVAAPEDGRTPALSLIPLSSQYLKAAATLARNQTQANEALLACVLERYRLAHHEYPETLAALTPQLADVLPHDIIGGQSLKYRRTADGSFLLYSVGWNEKDDGGMAGKTREEGDWVWQ
jgi:hypothetical protein